MNGLRTQELSVHEQPVKKDGYSTRLHGRALYYPGLRLKAMNCSRHLLQIRDTARLTCVPRPTPRHYRI
jgi:hypothetical protein